MVHFIFIRSITKNGKRYLPSRAANFYFTVVSEPFAKRQHTTSSLGTDESEPFFDSVSTRLKAEAILSTKNCAEIRVAEAPQRAANKTISQNGKVGLISRAGISTRIYRAENWIIT